MLSVLWDLVSGQRDFDVRQRAFDVLDDLPYISGDGKAWARGEFT